MQKVCRTSSRPFTITEAEVAFYQKVSPVIAGKQYLIPLPALSPEERRRRRWVFRNEHNLYSNVCAKTGKPLISMYPPSLPIKIYDQQLWWDKSWDGTEYGRDFDFSRPFFEQFAELLRTVPQPNLLNDALSNENSDYVNCTINVKNCYMIADAGQNQDCYYSNIINGSKNCVDCTAITDSELCYDCVGVVNCYNGKYLIDSDNCRDSAFLYACKSCSDCFGCSNLRFKQYCWNNVQLTKEEYESRYRSINLRSFSEYQKQKSQFLASLVAVPRQYAYLINCENSTGNVLAQSHNAKACFDSDKSQDSAYLVSTKGVRDSHDIEHTYNAELSLEVMAATNIYQNLFCCYTINSQNVLYSYLVSASNNCFGCVGVKKQSYCIFNKKYSKEEYDVLVPKIIEHMQKTGEWGEFFPAGVSLHGYNESLAADCFPLSKSEVEAYGAHWCDYEAPKPQASQVLAAADLPGNSSEAKEDICQKVIQCNVSGKLFRITKQEFQFYQDQGLPLPRQHHDLRYQARLSLRLPRMLWERQCDCRDTTHNHADRCSHKFESPYMIDRPEHVYCEKCYQQIVV